MTKRKTSSWTFSEAQLTMFPELRHFVDGQAPAEDLQAYFRFQRGWPTVAVVAIGVLLAPPLALLLHRGFGVGLAATVAVVVGVQLLVAWSLLGMLFPALQRRRIRAALQDRLRASGLHPCPICAYDRRGSPGPCPECGARDEHAAIPDSEDAPPRDR